MASKACDKNGCEVKTGDEVTVKFRVTGCSPSGDCSLEACDADQNGCKATLSTHCCCVEKCETDAKNPAAKPTK